MTIRTDYEAKNYAVYVILGYDIDGRKELLGLWLNETESKHQWMQIFDELKTRGVEDILVLSMDGVSGLEEGAKSVFHGMTVQRCIVHLIRNSIKYVPNKDYLRITELEKKWNKRPVANWAMVRNQLDMDERFRDRIRKYENGGL